MRFVGLLGIPTILAIAYALSTNRKAVKPRILMWGLSLQLLFAMIILSNSFYSFVGMFIFASLILLYVFKDVVFAKEHWRQTLLPVSVVIAFAALVTAFTYFLETLGVAIYVFWLLVLTWLVLLIIKKQKYVRFLFSGIMLTALGILFGRQIIGKALFAKVAEGVTQFLSLSDLGATFLFGNLAKSEFFFTDGSAWPGFGYQFAFSVLPVILFFSAFISILYYFGLIQKIIGVMARFMRWTMGTSGAETLSCSANIFVGQTEAPLLIKPLLDDMTISELHAVMVGGFATIAGSVLGGYIKMGVDAGNLLTASVMAAPGALVIAKILFPETEHSKTAGDMDIPDVGRADNLLDAASRGVTDGLHLALNVGAMLIAFIALIGLVDSIFAWGDKLVDHQLFGGMLNEATGEYRGFFPGSLKTFLGTLFSPLAFVMGVPWDEAVDVGSLIGIKIAVNEFVGYAQLGQMINDGVLSERDATIATFDLCGFANFSSIGIQIGGIGALAPNRRAEISRIALRAMIGGALVSFMSATLAGLLV